MLASEPSADDGRSEMRSGAAGWRLGESFDYRGDHVAYDIFGEGPPVVLVHGTPFSSYVWRRIAPALAENYAVYVYDLLGYGASEKRGGQDVSLYAQGRLLAALLGHWELESPYIVAHDIGGAITLRAHLLEGRDFERIVLVDAVSVAPWGSPLFRLAHEYPGVFTQIPGYIHQGMVAAYVRDATYRPMTEEEMAPYVEPWLGEEGQAALYRQMAQNDQRYTDEIEPLYGRIGRPVLVLWGEEDRWIPLEIGKKLHAAIPGSQLETISECAHLVQEDAEETVLDHLTEFFSRG
jgi:pimeloyl-ACP methyl ester carboxylesterase